jgi:DNA-binding CsgD family transcriptional regulator
MGRYISKASQRKIDQADQEGHSRDAYYTAFTKDLSAVVLSERQKEIIIMILQNENTTNNDTADRFSISLSTVNTHVDRLFRKLGVTSKSELIALYRNNPELQKAHGVNIPEQATA